MHFVNIVDINVIGVSALLPVGRSEGCGKPLATPLLALRSVLWVTQDELIFYVVSFPATGVGIITSCYAYVTIT